MIGRLMPEAVTGCVFARRDSFLHQAALHCTRLATERLTGELSNLCFFIRSTAYPSRSTFY